MRLLADPCCNNLISTTLAIPIREQDSGVNGFLTNAIHIELVSASSVFREETSVMLQPYKDLFNDL